MPPISSFNNGPAKPETPTLPHMTTIANDYNDDNNTRNLPTSSFSSFSSPSSKSAHNDKNGKASENPGLLDDDSHSLTAAKDVHELNRLDKKSVHYVMVTAVAGGLAGCSAKTLIAPLDRIKILFQTSNPEFKQYSSSLFGLFKATKKIYKNDGFVGFFQGHSVTLFRIFPYAAIKFVAYEQIRNLLIPNDLYETNGRRLLAGSISGIMSVFFTYPLDLLRVRLAFETRNIKHSAQQAASPTSTSSQKQMAQAISNLAKKAPKHVKNALINGRLLGTVSSILKEPTKYKDNKFSKTVPSSIVGITNFYRGFSPTILGMIPYAGVSFWTHDFVHDIFRSKLLAKITVDNSEQYQLDKQRQKLAAATKNTEKGHSHDSRPPLKAWAQLIAGGMAGLVSQTAAYPFEIIRRRLQVGAVTNNGQYFSLRQMASMIYTERGLKGFYVGLSIGYIKVIPMAACSLFVYERLKFIMGI